MQRLFDKRGRVYLVVEWGFLNGVFFLLNYAAFGSWLISFSYAKLLLLMNGSWAAVFLWSGRPRAAELHRLTDVILESFRTVLLMLYFTSLVIVLWGVADFSRIHVLGGFASLFTFRAILYGGRCLHLNGKRGGKAPVAEPSISQSFLLAASDFALLVFAFTLVHFSRSGGLRLGIKQLQIFLALTGFWMMMGQFTGKFKKRDYRNIYYAFSPFIKSAFLMGASMALMFFALHLLYLSRMQIFGTILLLLLMEVPLCYLYFRIRRYGREERDIESLEEAQAVFAEEEQRGDPVRSGVVQQAVRDKLRQDYLSHQPKVLAFVEKHIDTEKVEADETLVVNTDEFNRVADIEDGSLALFVNLHRVNDFRRINQYFLEVHKKFLNGGYIVGKKDTLQGFRAAIYKKFPRYIAVVVNALAFLFRRVLPKLPIAQRVYFAITGGKNRHLSRTELLGRLSFCGFKVIAEEMIDDHLYFIAQKVKSPSLDRNPSYGPLINLKRVGYQGETIYIKKLRTMHPYSEYLQDYVYQQNALDTSGKFRDDFRVAQWGKVFRKLWLDELPQFYNFLRGDVNLVGVRALSQHYFSLYPEDLKELRTQFKPGLIPPYYADMPKSFEEIVESERKYLESKKKRPFITDVTYFGRAMFNIVFRGARSG